METETTSVVDLLALVQSVQERRARAYARFDAALRESLQAMEKNPQNPSLAQAEYEKVVREVTDELTDLNEETGSIQATLAGRSDGVEAVSLLQRIQALEDECAKAKISLHVLRRSSAAGLRSPEGGEDTLRIKTDELTKKLEHVVGELNEANSEVAEMRMDLGEGGTEE